MTQSPEELIDKYTQLFRDFDAAITEMAANASERLGFTITKRQIIESFYAVMELSENIGKPIETTLKEALATATAEAEKEATDSNTGD